MMKKLLIITLLASVTVLTGCIAKNNIDIEIPPQQKLIVVECYLTSGHPPELTLTESNTLDRELGFLILGDAQTYIRTDTGAIQLQNIGYQVSQRQYVVNYSCKDTIQNEHPYYQLDITTRDGRKVEASASTISQVQLLDVHVDEKGITVTHNIGDAGDKYFKLAVTSFKDGKQKQTKFEFYYQNNGAAGPCVLPWEHLKAEADSVNVSLFHISKEYFDYLHSVRNANSAYKDPFLTPEVIKSNVKGGIGIFTYYTLDSRSVIL